MAIATAFCCASNRASLDRPSPSPITIVLVWYDYPADVNAFYALVNNLDLAVTVTFANGTSRIYLGNNDENAGGHIGIRRRRHRK